MSTPPRRSQRCVKSLHSARSSHLNTKREGAQLTAHHVCLRLTQAVVAKGGRFLEAPVSGSKKPAMDGTPSSHASPTWSPLAISSPRIGLLVDANVSYIRRR